MCNGIHHKHRLTCQPATIGPEASIRLKSDTGWRGRLLLADDLAFSTIFWTNSCTKSHRKAQMSEFASKGSMTSTMSIYQFAVIPFLCLIRKSYLFISEEFIQLLIYGWVTIPFIKLLLTDWCLLSIRTIKLCLYI